MTQNRAIFAGNEEQTRRIALRLAALLRPGDVICLRGDLGAGKTTFTRWLAAGMGSPALVSSPTFTLIHEYAGGRLPIYHADAYRLRGPAEAEQIGLEDYLLRGDGVTIIEWPERIEAILPPERLDITLEEEGDGRRLTFAPHGKRWENIGDLP